MKIINLFYLLIISVVTLSSCNKDENKYTLEDFCRIKPADWECEIIESNFNLADIPQNAEAPIAIVKYTNPNIQFEGPGQTSLTLALILDLYPINKKEELISFIKSQELYSWCIPVYYGETSEYFIITSPCFIIGRAFSEEANSCIEDLYTALDKIIIKKSYDLL